MVFFRPFRNTDFCDNRYKIEFSIDCEQALGGISQTANRFLSRATNIAGNRKTWTVSFWAKNNQDSNKNFFAFGIDGSNGEAISSVGGFLSYSNLNGSVGTTLTTTANLRDNTGWKHIVVAFDSTQATASNRVRFYVNGIEYSFTGGTVTLNADSFINSINRSSVGAGTTTAAAVPTPAHQISEFNFIDGLQLSANSFGFFSSSGEWIPRQYNGSYGARGFYLNFSNNLNLGQDFSGNAIDYTNSINPVFRNNDTPTNNSPTFNIFNQQGNTNGRIAYNSNNNANGDTAVITHAISRGKYYLEFSIAAVNPAGSTRVGITPTRLDYVRNYFIGSLLDSYAYRSDGLKINNNASAAFGATYTSGDIIGVAVDFDNNRIWFSKNGVWQASGNPAANLNPAFTIAPGEYYIGTSFGAATNSVVGYLKQPNNVYAPPTGFLYVSLTNKLAQDTPPISEPDKFFDIVTYTGNGTTQNITSLKFQPDLVIIKRRDTTGDWEWVDSTRGAPNSLSCNTTNAQSNDINGLTAFNTNGFTLGSDSNYNASGGTYVAYCFSKSIISGFDIVQYTGTGVSRTVNHNLGVAPSMIIVKAINANGTNWMMYQTGLVTPATQYMTLNTTNAATTDSTVFGALATSSSFTVGTNANTNANGTQYIAYVFADVQAYQRANYFLGANSRAVTAQMNFRPSFYFRKNSTAAPSGWAIYDNKINLQNPRSIFLGFQSNAAEVNSGDYNFFATNVLNDPGEVLNNRYIYFGIADYPEVNQCSIMANGG